MGIADRDYMRERHARRNGVRWNEKRSRVEFDEADLAAARYSKRRRARRPRTRSAANELRRLFLVLFSVAALFVGASLVRDLVRAKQGPFPQSGSVTVSDAPRIQSAPSGVELMSGPNFVIVQLLRPRTSSHLLSIYMRPYDRRVVPVPSGTWRVRLIIGRDWQGPRKLFGEATRSVQLPGLISFPPNSVRQFDMRQSLP